MKNLLKNRILQIPVKKPEKKKSLTILKQTQDTDQRLKSIMHALSFSLARVFYYYK